MDLVIILAALGSAALHAAWNAAVRASPDPTDAFGALVIGGGLWGIVGVLVVGLPSFSMWPWFLGSVVLNALAMRLMVASYERLAFAIAYPVTRGLYPPLLVAIAFFLFGEVPTGAAAAGIAVICVAILVLAVLARDTGPRALQGVALALAAAGVTAAYVACDVSAARVAGSPYAYAFTVSIANAVAFGGLLMLEGRRPVKALLARPVFGAVGSAASSASYLLIMAAFTIAPAAPVAALRETSILFATVYAALFLGERLKPVHWLASGLATAGVMLMRLG